MGKVRLGPKKEEVFGVTAEMKTILNRHQSDLLQGLVLEPVFNSKFYLSGGTALAQYYLHHRYSEDLDFFCEEEVDTLWLTGLAAALKAKTGAGKFDFEQSFNRNLVYFSYGKEVVKTEFTYYPFVQIEEPMTVEGLKVDSLIDIAVNKLFTTYQKPSARHFIDLYLILKTGKVTWGDLTKLARIKFDTAIDPLQLGSQLVTAESISDLPRMIMPLPEKQWRQFFMEKASALRSSVLR